MEKQFWSILYIAYSNKYIYMDRCENISVSTREISTHTEMATIFLKQINEEKNQK